MSSWRGVLNTILCYKVCRWLYPDTPVLSINKNNRHDIAKIFSGVKHPNTPIRGNIETPSQNSISISYFMKLQTYK